MRAWASEARSALLDGDGDAGRALEAVLAHERDDVEAVSRTGLAPIDVSHAYLESLRDSLQIVHDLQGDECPMGQATIKEKLGVRAVTRLP